ncbi:MAG TPA: serine hydrolase domain-containing protein [Opitutaceae bacterium]
MTSAAAPRLNRRTSGGWIIACMFLLAAGLATLARGAVDTRAVDAIFAQWDKPTSPGAALAVIQDGRIVYEKGYGMANLEAKTPITPETVFYVGSVSKQFTAAAIALLHQRGQVSLDDDVRKYVPEIPDYGAPISIRHCILHSSGLRDYLGLRDLAGENVNATFGDADVLALIRRQKGLNFPTGTEYLYSNSGYFLLSLVVKRVTGKSLREFAAAEFFGPLGMSTAQYRDNHKHPIARRAEGYAAVSGGYRVNNPNFDVVGAGGVFMTVRDFLAWDHNFYDPKVGGPGFVSLIQTPGALNDGSKIAYAFGLVTGRYRGLEIVEHSGAYGGFRAHVIRFPEKRFSVVCFTNLGTMAPGELVRAVANVCLASDLAKAETAAPGREKAPAKAAKKAAKSASSTATVALSPTEATRIAGSYRSAELGVDYRIRANVGGTLTLERKGRPNADLVSTGPDTLTTGPLRLRFRRDAQGAPASFTLEAGRVRDIVFTRQ